MVWRWQSKESLQKSMALLDEVLSKAPAVLYCCEPGGKYAATYISSNIKDQLGYQPEEFTSDPDFWADHIHPEDREGVLAGVENLFKDDQHIHEYRFQHKDGDYRWMRDELRLVRDEDGTPLQITGYWVDISDRKAIEEKLRGSLEISEMKFSRALEANPDAILITRLADGRIMQVNEGFTRLSGYTREEALGKTTLELAFWISPQDRLSFIKLFEEKESVTDVELVFRKKDGGLIHALASANLLEIEGERYLFSIMRDISERKQSVEALRDSEMKFRDLVSAAPDGTVIVNERGEIEIVNQQLEKMTGYRAEELIGKPVEVLVPKRFSKHKQLRDAYLASPRIYAIGEGRELYCRRKDGSEIPVEISLGPLSTEEGLLISAALRDISWRKQAEEELRLSRKRLRNLAQRLLEASEVSQSRIAREIHDELGQSLTGLRIDLKWLLEQVTPGVFAERARAALMLVDEMQEMVRRMIQELRPAMLDDLGLVAAIEWQMEEFRKRTGIHCEMNLPMKEIGLVSRRDIVVYRVLQEALTNVMQHARASQVKVSLSIDDAQLVLTVEDNGIGVGDMGKISHKDSVGIMGMQERCDAVGGKLQIEAIEKGGTRLICTVPLNSIK